MLQHEKIGTSFLYFLISSNLGTVALHCVRFGVSWLIMQKTGSAIAFAVIFSISNLVEVYSKPVLSPMADYFDRLRVYRSCVGVASITVVLLLLGLLVLPFSMIFVATLLMVLSLVAGLRDPAAAGLVPALVGLVHLTRAQAIRSSANSIVSLGAPMLGALLLAIGGVTAALSVAAITAALGLIATFGIHIVRSDVLAAPKCWSEYLKTWHLRTIAGVRAVVMTRAERTMALAVALTNAGLFPFFTVVLPLWAGKTPGASANLMAAIEVAFGIGILLASTFLVQYVNNRLGRFMALVCGNGMLGAGLLGAAFISNPGGLALCFVLGGAGFAIFNINASTLRAAATPAIFRSRMAAGVAFLSSCLNPFATQGMGFVIESTSVASACALSGIFILVSTVLLLRNSDAKMLLLQTDPEINEAYAKMYPQAFCE